MKAKFSKCVILTAVKYITRDDSSALEWKFCKIDSYESYVEFQRQITASYLKTTHNCRRDNYNVYKKYEIF